MTQTTWIIAEVFVGISLLMMLTAFLTRWFSPPAQRGPDEILKERYARGELSRVEYQQMAGDLGITIPRDESSSSRARDQGMETRIPSGHATDP